MLLVRNGNGYLSLPCGHSINCQLTFRFPRSSRVSFRSFTFRRVGYVFHSRASCTQRGVLRSSPAFRGGDLQDDIYASPGFFPKVNGLTLCVSVRFFRSPLHLSRLSDLRIQSSGKIYIGHTNGQWSRIFYVSSFYGLTRCTANRWATQDNEAKLLGESGRTMFKDFQEGVSTRASGMVYGSYFVSNYSL